MTLLFNELLQYIPWNTFYKYSGQLNIDKWKKKFSVQKTFLVLFLWEILKSDSIRWLLTSLEIHREQLYHMGFGKDIPKRSTISDRINKIPPIIFKNMFYELVNTVKRNIWNNKDLKKIYAIDSSTISLWVNAFNRAFYRKSKWWIKLNTRIDLSESLPDLVEITTANKHDSKVTYQLLDWVKNGDTIVFDRWYLDYNLLNYLNKRGIFFVTRTKKNTDYCPIRMNKIENSLVLCDAECEFTQEKSFKKYPQKFRIVRYHVDNLDKDYEYITNNLLAPAEIIADIYKQRRTIETLFKDLKQKLKIKQFFWTSKNAVENQIRIALIYYLVMVLIKIKTFAKESLLELFRKCRELVFYRTTIVLLLRKPLILHDSSSDPPMLQLSLFE